MKMIKAMCVITAMTLAGSSLATADVAAPVTHRYLIERTFRPARSTASMPPPSRR
jgi:hypothetical protein